MSRARTTLSAAALALLLASRAWAGDAAPAAPQAPAPAGPPAIVDTVLEVGDETPLAGGAAGVPAAAPSRADGLTPLVPELAAHPYALAPGPRPFLGRFAVSPGFGTLGTQRYFLLRLAYNPNRWLGYEAMIGHNPSESVHAIVHMLNAVVRRPLPGRFQPYASAGYGMTVVLPGRSVNADPVTKNMLALGGGLEFYIRSDLAIRAEMRGVTVFGRQLNRDGVVAYDYLEQTVGLAFYRTLKP